LRKSAGSGYRKTGFDAFVEKLFGSALIAAAGLAAGCRGPADPAASVVQEPPLARQYVAGETVRYPVDVVAMRCRDAALKDCTDRTSYRIHRRIELRQHP